MAASDADVGWSGTKGYTLGGLFAMLSLLSVVLARGLSTASAYMQRNKRSALLHVFEHLQVELMLLGMLSLLLTAAQDGLMRICVRASGSAASGRCPEGEAPLWSATTLHQTHIFIFILACTHVCYVAISTYVCSWKLRQWRKWEREGDASVVALNPKINPRNATGLVNLMWRAFWSQFTFAVNREMYLSLRRLFLERTGATTDFNFYDYLRESMEEDMSSLIGMTVLMWCMATVFVTVPQALFLSAGLVCLGLMLFVGMMLESVALRLAQAAYERFNDDGLDSDEEDDALDIHIEKSQTMKRRELRREIDSKNFFWLGRPRLLLQVFQFVLFENAISLSMLIFSLWQDTKWLSSSAKMSVGVAWALFAVDFCVLLHSAMFILPVYAITSTVGSHCATSLQEYADKLGITKEAALAAYLERTKKGMSTEDAVELASYDLSLLEKNTEQRVSLSADTSAQDVESAPAKPPLPAGLSEIFEKQRPRSLSQPSTPSRGSAALQARQAQVRWSKATAHVTKQTKHSIVPMLGLSQPDYSRENEASLTGLLGAMLSKQMKAELERQKAEKAQREREAAKNASPGVMGALQRTFSRANLSSDQPPADIIMESEPSSPPKPPLSPPRPLTSRPSMRDVFLMHTPPPPPSKAVDENPVEEVRDNDEKSKE